MSIVISNNIPIYKAYDSNIVDVINFIGGKNKSTFYKTTMPVFGPLWPHLNGEDASFSLYATDYDNLSWCSNYKHSSIMDTKIYVSGRYYILINILNSSDRVPRSNEAAILKIHSINLKELSYLSSITNFKNRDILILAEYARSSVYKNNADPQLLVFFYNGASGEGVVTSLTNNYVRPNHRERISIKGDTISGYVLSESTNVSATSSSSYSVRYSGISLSKTTIEGLDAYPIYGDYLSFKYSNSSGANAQEANIVSGAYVAFDNSDLFSDDTTLNIKLYCKATRTASGTSLGDNSHICSSSNSVLAHALTGCDNNLTGSWAMTNGGNDINFYFHVL